MEPYLGQIELFGFGYAPEGWAQCNGQLLPINQNQALFALIGTYFGGNGTTTFALPDLRGRLAVGQGSGSGLTPRTVGAVFGEENHVLSAAETPAHVHTLNAAANTAPGGNTDTPGPAVVLTRGIGKLANPTPVAINYLVADAAPRSALDRSAVAPAGGQPHANMMPFLALNFCIALQGIFPPRP
jgi:microcystin-dependent protein